MLSHIIYSLSFKMIYIVYLGQKRGGGGGAGPLGPPLNPPLIYYSWLVEKYTHDEIGLSIFRQLYLWIVTEKYYKLAYWVNLIKFTN